jgi:hypothetical protein
VRRCEVKLRTAPWPRPARSRRTKRIPDATPDGEPRSIDEPWASLVVSPAPWPALCRSARSSQVWLGAAETLLAQLADRAVPGYARLAGARHERRDDCVEVVRRCFDPGIALDQFERIHQVCADIVGLSALSPCSMRISAWSMKLSVSAIVSGSVAGMAHIARGERSVQRAIVYVTKMRHGARKAKGCQ